MYILILFSNDFMKIYILTREPFPNGMAATNRIKCYAKAILEKGVPCEVLICTRTEVYGKAPKNTIGEGVFENIPYKYIGGTPLRGSNIVLRQINDRIDKMRTMQYLFKHLKEDDIVFGYCGVFPHFINMIIRITHMRKAFYFRDLCELPYGTSQETDRNIKLRKFTLFKQFPLCDGFIAISDALVTLAEKYKRTNAKVLKVPILVDFEKYCLTDQSNKVDIPYIFHSGTLYEQKDGILGMIEAFGIALRQIPFPIRFISTGKPENSPHKEAIYGLIEKYQLKDKLLFTGYLSESELKDYLSKASLVIINKYDTQQNKYCFSTKLAEYLAASKPVIITKVGEAMNWLTNDKDAYIIETQRIDALAEKIVEAFTDVQKRYAIAENGFKTCKSSFDYRNYSKQLIEFFTQISNDSN